MFPSLSLDNPDILPTLMDDGYPTFVNAANETPEEPGDWWLDLGRVDVPEVPAV